MKADMHRKVGSCVPLVASKAERRCALNSNRQLLPMLVTTAVTASSYHGLVLTSAPRDGDQNRLWGRSLARIPADRCWLAFRTYSFLF